MIISSLQPDGFQRPLFLKMIKAKVYWNTSFLPPVVDLAEHLYVPAITAGSSAARAD